MVLMDLNECRARIDKIDDALIALFIDRMDISKQIALYKKEHNMPALDARRESEKLSDVGEKAGDELRSYAQQLYKTLFDLSRAYQGSILNNS